MKSIRVLILQTRKPRLVEHIGPYCGLNMKFPPKAQVLKAWPTCREYSEVELWKVIEKGSDLIIGLIIEK
jgi:hypothetical protein